MGVNARGAGFSWLGEALMQLAAGNREKKARDQYLAQQDERYRTGLEREDANLADERAWREKTRADQMALLEQQRKDAELGRNQQRFDSGYRMTAGPVAGPKGFALPSLKRDPALDIDNQNRIYQAREIQKLTPTEPRAQWQSAGNGVLYNPYTGASKNIGTLGGADGVTPDNEKLYQGIVDQYIAAAGGDAQAALNAATRQDSRHRSLIRGSRGVNPTAPITAQDFVAGAQRFQTGAGNKGKVPEELQRLQALRSLATVNNPQAQIAFINNFQKLIDKGGVVREADVQLLRSAASQMQKARNAWENKRTGQILSTEQMQGYIKAAEAVVRGMGLLDPGSDGASGEATMSRRDLWEKKVDEGMDEDSATEYVNRLLGG